MSEVRKHAIEVSIVISAETRPDDAIENLDTALRSLQERSQVEDWHVMSIAPIDVWGARLNDDEGEWF